MSPNLAVHHRMPLTDYWTDSLPHISGRVPFVLTFFLLCSWWLTRYYCVPKTIENNPLSWVNSSSLGHL